jgi:hypothetical protein
VATCFNGTIGRGRVIEVKTRRGRNLLVLPDKWSETLRIEARNDIGKMTRPSGESEIKFRL